MLLRILLRNYEHPPIVGGAATATQQTTFALVDVGHQVSVLTKSVGDSISLIEGPRLIDMNPVYAAEIGEKAREFVMHEFYWSAIASGYLSLSDAQL